MEIIDEDIRLFIETVKSNSAYDFSEYTEKSFKRRIEKVVADNRLTVNELVRKMEKDDDFLEKMVRDITVNTTELLRDPNVWIMLKDKILPEFQDKEMINIWHAGCSSGQEVYSMMILLNELNLLHKANILGTDLNTTVLDEARKGVYKYTFNKIYIENFDAIFNTEEEIKKRKSPLDFEKYFDINKTKDTMVAKSLITGKAIFRKHDLVNEKNKFDMNFDIIICRNVLIYFNTLLQNRVFELFHNSLKDKSYLVIGLHESILGPFSSRFDKKQLYYQKRNV
ncbi:MAG TPA: chemotaxis protein CheR [Bacteroidales bacterium]|nr:MAG: hypothetical protein A2W98_04035 [Bacteroidetes bacterium GWF2_33_38]OFY71181.1 MAG: hypothetical protein A2265_00920 [Bacteroidetes bacterium RIFOXYA12_FULL_33_9]OFY92417.1 MAG: hypothetical protein A2236_05800 [Bacteroidetes bacterium RIFOXYA2_FULL_33_7]HBF89062.1 chemotaxis protein CheR [Bacteroidales bacterium]